MNLTIVGPLQKKDIHTVSANSFAKINKRKVAKIILPVPTYDPKNNFAFEHRDIPTAYLRFKFNAPPAKDPDFAALRLLFHILSKELGEEVRTKRSLSYAIYAFTAQFTIGYGSIGAWTSKPKETLAAIKEVLQKLKDRELTKQALTEYKTVFATNYFLDLETNGSLASSLSESQFYHDGYEEFYNYPRKIDAVTPKDIKRLANSVLKNFRLGVIYHKDKFKREWFNM